MRVLIVKISSMGDIVQLLPALTDAVHQLPGIKFDWVADEAFAEIPGWHKAVDQVISSAHRRWQKHPLTTLKNKELVDFWSQLRATHYDLVIDGQNNYKSALVTLLAKGTKYGLDRYSVWEPGVHLAYQKRYRINKDQLAIDRHRQLFSQVLGYPLPTTPPDFGLADHPWPTPLIDIPKAPFLVFVSQASWTNKCWPVAYWRQLIELAGQQGYRVLLPWGTVDEQQRARQLAASFSHIQILPHLSLSEIAAIMLASAGVVANDTGLAHVAASLDIPVVTLYGPTNPLLIGATGRYSKHLVATGFDCIPCHKRICQTTDYKGPEGQCLKTLAVHKVWQALIEMKSDYLPVLNKES